MSHGPKTRNELRTRRHIRIRACVRGTALRPRLVVHKSNRFISGQLIDDVAEKTIAAAHGREFKGTAREQAKAVGEAIAKRAKIKGILSVVFDRGGYRYGGHIQALADAAREKGLAF